MKGRKTDDRGQTTKDKRRERTDLIYVTRGVAWGFFVTTTASSWDSRISPARRCSIAAFNWKAFSKSTGKHVPDAAIRDDKFPVMRHLGEA